MKVVRLSTLRTSLSYPQEIPLVLIFIRGWVDPRNRVRLEGLNRWKIPLTQTKLKPATIRLAARCINPNVLNDNDDNHKKLQVSCLLAENNIRIRNTAFQFTKSFDRIFIWETSWISMNSILPRVLNCLIISTLACVQRHLSEYQKQRLQIAVANSFCSFLLEHHKH